MKRETVPSYPWRDHLIKENETETIAMQAVGQSRKLHFLIFKISITSDIAKQNKIRLPFTVTRELPLLGFFLAVGSLDQIFL